MELAKEEKRKTVGGGGLVGEHVRRVVYHVHRGKMLRCANAAWLTRDRLTYKVLLGGEASASPLLPHALYQLISNSTPISIT